MRSFIRLCLGFASISLMRAPETEEQSCKELITIEDLRQNIMPEILEKILPFVPTFESQCMELFRKHNINQARCYPHGPSFRYWRGNDQQEITIYLTVEKMTKYGIEKLEAIRMVFPKDNEAECPLYDYTGWIDTVINEDDEECIPLSIGEVIKVLAAYAQYVESITPVLAQRGRGSFAEDDAPRQFQRLSRHALLSALEHGFQRYVDEENRCKFWREQEMAAKTPEERNAVFWAKEAERKKMREEKRQKRPVPLLDKYTSEELAALLAPIGVKLRDKSDPRPDSAI